MVPFFTHAPCRKDTLMNSHRGPRSIVSGMLFLFGLLISVCTGPGAGLAQKGETKKNADKTGVTPAPADANELSMEVNALRTLYLLRGTDPDAAGTQNPVERLRTIIKRKKEYAACAQPKNRAQADISDAYRKTLVELRAALIAQQDEQIEKLDKKLQDLQKIEDPNLDDQIDITEQARKSTPRFVKLDCNADQVVTYLASYGKDLPNPLKLMFTATRIEGKHEKPTPEAWKKIRAFTIREVTWQVAGINVAKGDRIEAQVGDLLDKAHAMSEDDLKVKHMEIRKEARGIIDNLGPTDLIKNVIEQDVAELLSNPRLIPAVQARLKYLAAKEKK